MALATPENADRLARQVLRRRLRVRPKENVTIETYPTALPWAAGFVREARRIGARPLLHFEDEQSYWSAVEEGRAVEVGTPSDAEWKALEGSDVYIYFWGPEDQARMRALPEAVREKLTAFNGRWYDTARKAGVRGARMAIARATTPNAQHWGVSREKWERDVFAASMRGPRTMVSAARKVQQAFEKGRSLRLRHPNGTDLRLALAGRPVTVSLGEITPADLKTRFGRMTSVPEGTAYVAVEEDTAEGRFRANRTSGQFGAPAVGGRLEFKNGRLTSFSFDRGGRPFAAGYRSGGAGRDRPSFIEVGFHPDVRGVPVLEELEQGAVTVGVGGNSGFGGKTKSDFQGYVTIGGAELSVDGRPLVRAGRIV